jgi:hypothetical protein
LPDRIRNDAIPAWERLVGGSGDSMHDHVSLLITAPGYNADWDVLFKELGGCRLLVRKKTEPTMEHGVRKTRVQAFCRGERYTFILDRESSDEPWKLTNLTLTQVDGDESRSSKLLHLDRYGYMAQNQPILVETHSLLDLIKNELMHVISLKARTVKGIEVVDLEFEVNRPAKETALSHGDWFNYKRGRITVVPSQQWAIQSYQLVSRSDNQGTVATVVATNTLDYGPGGVFVKDRQRRVEITAAKDPTLVGTVEEVKMTTINRHIGSGVSSSDFTLTAFGLPEPPGVRKPGVPWFLWLGGAGVLLVLAAFLVQRWRQKVA